MKANYGWDAWTKVTCNACGGHIEEMGRVQKDRLVKDVERTPCDDRCTAVAGPSCDCRCGGENHGSLRTVSVTLDAGGVPRVENDPDATERAEEYRAMKSVINDMILGKYPIEAREVRREYLSPALWEKYLEGKRHMKALAHAAGLKVHKSRMAKMGKLLEALRAVTAYWQKDRG